MLITKCMVKVHINGLMENHTKEVGIKDKYMETDQLSMLMVLKRVEPGKMENYCNGSHEFNLLVKSLNPYTIKMNIMMFRTLI